MSLLQGGLKGSSSALISKLDGDGEEGLASAIALTKDAAGQVRFPRAMESGPVGHQLFDCRVLH